MEREGGRRWEKVGEGGEGGRRLENVGESLRKYEKGLESCKNVKRLEGVRKLEATTF